MRLAPLAILAAASLVACASTDDADTVVGSGGQIEWVSAQGAMPDVIVVVADDGPSRAAAELRASVAEAIGEAGRRIALDVYPPDPAAWTPLDLRALVVHPSAPAGARLVGPSDDPALHWQTHAATSEEQASFVAHLRAAMGTPAPSTTEYRPLEAAYDAVQLLARQRPPANAREAALLTSFPASTEALVLVASLRDDASPLEPEAYDIRVDASANVFATTAIVAPSEPSDICLVPAVAPSRLARWRADRSVGWPCDDSTLLADRIFSPFASTVGYRPLCLLHPVAVSSDGMAECVVTAETSDPAGCDPARGWLDPLDPDGVRRPRLVADTDAPTRLCEVAQLDGARRRACQTDPACPGCGSGFCGGAMPPTSGSCPRGTFWSGLRFVGGAMAGATATFRFACNVQ